MKVICIDASQKTPPVLHRLIEGGIYNAEQSVIKENYTILEHATIDNGMPCSFHKDRFIPLSEIDETELVQNNVQPCFI